MGGGSWRKNDEWEGEEWSIYEEKKEREEKEEGEGGVGRWEKEKRKKKEGPKLFYAELCIRMKNGESRARLS